MKKFEINANSTWCSQAVTHPTTNHAQSCLTAVIKREPVFTTWYGRWQTSNPNALMYVHLFQHATHFLYYSIILYSKTHICSHLYFDLLWSNVYKYFETCTMFTAYGDNTQLLTITWKTASHTRPLSKSYFDGFVTITHCSINHVIQETLWQYYVWIIFSTMNYIFWNTFEKYWLLFTSHHMQRIHIFLNN